VTRLFVFGFGYSARATAARMLPQGARVAGTTRESDKLAVIGSLGVTPLLFEGMRRELAIGDALAEADHILVSIPPGDAGDPVLRHHRYDLAAANPRALVYLSTVGVYGDHAGEWIDETSECCPATERGRRRLEAEAGWRRFSEETGIPVAILRLGGIYGPGRGPLEKIRAGKAQRIVKPGQTFNRIHVDDIATIVEAAFEKRAGGIFNGVDDEPAPPEDVIAFAARLMGLPPPPEVAFEDAKLSPMARSFYGESKRVRNDRIKSELGVQLAYPTYREGIAAILERENLRTPEAIDLAHTSPLRGGRNSKRRNSGAHEISDGG
jgi:nucleoside-diphosphate-sugar epimerase